MTIAVLCARNQRNGGMYSVDTAARQFFDALGAPYRLCRSQGESRWGALEYTVIREWQDLDPFDRIVFWGDWQTNPVFGEADYVHAEAKYESNRDQRDAMRRWRDIYQLAAMGDRDHRPVLTIGTSFIGVTGPQLAPSTLGHFRRYVARSAAIVPRDPESLAQLRTATPSASNIVGGGIDPAFLMQSRARGASAESSDYFCYSFDRSLKSRRKYIVAALSRATGLRPVAVDWNKRWYPRRLSHDDFAANLDKLANAVCCFTDIYHLSVNALNLGVPVICFGDRTARKGVTLDENKKAALFSQLECPELYVSIGADADISIATAAALLREAAFASRFAAVQRRLHDLKQNFRRSLATLLAA